MPGTPLSLPEREEISVALIEDRDASWASIGRRISRPPTTVMREVERNGGRHKYRPAMADKRAKQCRRRPRQRVLRRPGWLRERVTAELGRGRSPAAIWADLRAEGVPELVSIETIYTSLYAGALEVKATDCLRSRRPRRRSRQARHANQRPGLPNISLRPDSVNDRDEPGHWEADQIIGARNQSSMLWLTERVTRFAIGVTMPNGYAAEDTLAGLCFGLDRIPPHLRRSITFDQGSEWAKWEILADTFEIDVWFCDPHSPWQRGQVENQNRQWRWWFPRGIDLAAIQQDHVDDVASTINGQRRRNLNYQSPATLYHQLTVH